MANSGSLVAEISSGFMEMESELTVLSTLAEDMGRQIGARIIIVDNRGIVMGDSVRVGGHLGRELPRQEVEESLAGGIGSSVQYSIASEQWVMQVAVPIMIENDVIGSVFLSSSLDQVYEILRDIRSFLIIATILALVLVGFIAALMAKSVTTPIVELTSATKEMAIGNLTQQIPVRSRDEIGQLANQFNDMSVQMKETNSKLREFVANASHELRTPLTTINLLVNSLKEYADEKELRDEFIKDIEGETKRLVSLVSDLLNLARLEREDDVQLKKPLNFTNLVKETTAAAKSRVERQGLKLEYLDDGKDHVVVGIAEELKQVIYNLIDNAIKYTSPGGDIRIEVREKEKRVLVAVSDTGCGIPQTDLENIFTRFYRVDKARSREMGGTGLGLSICREIIAHHGGEIWVESDGEKGSIFYVSLDQESVKKN